MRKYPAAASPRASRDGLLDRLVTNASKRAYGIAYNLLRDTAEAEDAVQDSLTKVCQNHSSLRDDAAAEAWFLRIVTTSCLRTLRRRRLKEAILGRSKYQPTESIVPSGERVLSEHQNAAELVELVRVLPPMQQVAIVLRYGHELPLGEIAALTDTKISTVKTHLARTSAATPRTLAESQTMIQTTCQTIEEQLSLGEELTPTPPRYTMESSDEATA